MDSNDPEKAQFSASLSASIDRDFKGFPFSLIVLNWIDYFSLCFSMVFSLRKSHPPLPCIGQF